MLQRDFKEKIAAIRAICLSFAQGPLHQSISVGDASSTPAFKKYSTLLKVLFSNYKRHADLFADRPNTLTPLAGSISYLKE
jgi:hypothetical protein